jgi:hypothetical protein
LPTSGGLACASTPSITNARRPFFPDTAGAVSSGICEPLAEESYSSSSR